MAKLYPVFSSLKGEFRLDVDSECASVGEVSGPNELINCMGS
jgi:hypothetical protein